MSKRFSDYTVGDMHRLNYSLLRNNLDEEDIQPMVDAIKYAVKMSSVLNKNIDEWRVIEAFGTGDGVSITTDMNKINRILVEYKQINSDSKLICDINHNRKQLVECVSDKSSRIAKVNAEIDSLNARIQRLSSDCVRLSERVRVSVSNLNELRSIDPDVSFIDKIKELEELDFFTFSSMTISNHIPRYAVLSFITNNVLVNNEVYLGSYRVDLTLRGSGTTIKVYKHNNNTVSDGYYHPYISSDGGICWGNVNTQASDLMKDGKLFELMSLLKLLLITYVENTTPWQALMYFEVAIKLNKFKEIYNHIVDLHHDNKDIIESDMDMIYYPVKLVVPDNGYGTGQTLFIRPADSSSSTVNVYNTDGRYELDVAFNKLDVGELTLAGYKRALEDSVVILNDAISNKYEEGYKELDRPIEKRLRIIANINLELNDITKLANIQC